MTLFFFFLFKNCTLIETKAICCLEIPVEVICEMDDTTKEQGNNGKIQDTRNYALEGAGTGWSI